MGDTRQEIRSVVIQPAESKARSNPLLVVAVQSGFKDTGNKAVFCQALFGSGPRSAYLFQGLCNRRQRPIKVRTSRVHMQKEKWGCDVRTSRPTRNIGCFLIVIDRDCTYDQSTPLAHATPLSAVFARDLSRRTSSTTYYGLLRQEHVVLESLCDTAMALTSPGTSRAGGAAARLPNSRSQSCRISHLGYLLLHPTS